ncbi:DUF1285 domain-containing protein [Albimonas sp. CAU 1670]|uniref:DUF1285 domain-containing protein n=1 Tax=Albimonas sp. CAU 1670 TaxID=3032599 RepID=UPI0023DAE804|nr:DUF1285 domain-containing protein [Albimonas sp. CAU 1670]MDF2235826.1 DUF1285 domain-containing protein [Albimonas sp. CAU 1670]
MAETDQDLASRPSSDAAEGAAAPNADGLAKSIQTLGKKRGPAPVHLWNPPFCGDLDMRIARDGTWWYLGTPIGRPALVKLFASVLRKDDDKYFLVTPVEKVGITVDDAPFVAVDFRVADPGGPDQALTFVTNVEDETQAGPEHPIRVARDPETGEPSPYVHVRANLEALIDRKSFYRLVDICEHREVEGESWFGVRSGGEFFPVIPSAELPE